MLLKIAITQLLNSQSDISMTKYIDEIQIKIIDKMKN